MRILKPIKNLKLPKTDRSSRNNKSQLSHRGRTTLIPSKVSLENQEGYQRKKALLQGNNFTKENFKPHKTIRNVYTLTKKASDKEEEEGIDFMQYWVRHRF